MKKIILLSVFLFIGHMTFAQKFQMIRLHGFNRDVVANGSGPDPVTSVTDSSGLDGVGWVFTSRDFVYKDNKPGYFLPDDHVLKSDSIKNLTYLLADYNGNNALLLNNNEDMLIFDTSRSAHTLYVLGTSGSGNATVTFTIYFSDGSTQTCDKVVFPDWFKSSGEVTVRERFSLKDKYFEVIPDNPGFSRATLLVRNENITKQITKIKARSSGDGYCALMAISIEP